MLADNREDGGKLVRQAWIYWAQQQPDPKPSWLVPWEELSESDKEADRQIWEVVTMPYRAILESLHVSGDIASAYLAALDPQHKPTRIMSIDGESIARSVRNPSSR